MGSYKGKTEIHSNTLSGRKKIQAIHLLCPIPTLQRVLTRIQVGLDHSLKNKVSFFDSEVSISNLDDEIFMPYEALQIM